MIWSLMAAVAVSGQNRPNLKPSSQPSKGLIFLVFVFWIGHLKLLYFTPDLDFPLTGSGLKSDCLGNVMRLTLDKALAVGNQLGVEAISMYINNDLGGGGSNILEDLITVIFVFSRWHWTHTVNPYLGCSVWIQHGVWPLGQHKNLCILDGLLCRQPSM